MFLEHFLALLFARLLVPPSRARVLHRGPALDCDVPERREQPSERELRREDDRGKQERQDQDDRSRPVEILRKERREPVADEAAGPELLAADVERPERQREERRDAAEEQPCAEQLRVRGIHRAAPEVVPAEDDEHQRDEVRRVAEHLVRQLADEGADAAREIGRRQIRSRVEEPHGVGRAVAGERDQPDERGGEQRDAQELARAAREGSGRHQISITTGRTNGRSPERFRKNRCRSTRIFSLISPGSVRSSTLAPSIAAPTSPGISRNSASVRASTTNPRVITSGVSSSVPDWRLIARTGTTRPSPARWRRSRSTSSPTSPLRVPSMRIRPAGTFSTIRAPSSSTRMRSPFSASTTFVPGEALLATAACRASCRYSPCIGTK